MLHTIVLTLANAVQTKVIRVVNLYKTPKIKWHHEADDTLVQCRGTKKGPKDRLEKIVRLFLDFIIFSMQKMKRNRWKSELYTILFTSGNFN